MEPLDLVAFLPGRWIGRGHLRDRPIEVAMSAGPVLGHYLQVDVSTTADGEVVHRERVLYHRDGAGGLVALTFDDAGQVQRWHVTAPAAQLRELRRLDRSDDEPCMLWTMELTSRDEFVERFLEGPDERNLTPLVTLRHQRRTS